MARFLSVDPLSPEYPYYTPYQFAGNKPIWANDVDGLEPQYSNDDKDGDTQSVDGVDYHYSEANGDWMITQFDIPYKPLWETLNNYIADNMQGNAGGWEVVGEKELVVAGIPLSVSLSDGDRCKKCVSVEALNFFTLTQSTCKTKNSI